MNNPNQSSGDRGATPGRQGPEAAECNELNLNLNLRHTRDSETRWQAGTRRGEEGTEYEYIPRVVRPLNHPQHRSNRIRTESQQQLRNLQRAGRWRNSQHQSLQVKENKRLFKLGADQLRADMIPTHLQIVGELNRDKGRSDLVSSESSNIRQKRTRYTGVRPMRTIRFKNCSISGNAELTAMYQKKSPTTSYALHVRIPTD